jgi:hypothetical protein
LTDYLSLGPQELLRIINEQRSTINEQPIFFLGDGLFLYKNLLKRNLGGQALFVSGADNFPRGANIALLGLKKLKREKPRPVRNKFLNGSRKLFSLKPLYVRNPDVTHKN